jgi:hypothetical protein
MQRCHGPWHVFEAPFTNLVAGGVKGAFVESDVMQLIKIVNSFNVTVGKEFGETA